MFINGFIASDIERRMWILVWMMVAAFMFLGFLFFSVMSVGAFIGLIVNLILLPLRIILAVIRALLGVF
jgi:hypothetical protein